MGTGTGTGLRDRMDWIDDGRQHSGSKLAREGSEWGSEDEDDGLSGHPNAARLRKEEREGEGGEPGVVEWARNEGKSTSVAMGHTVYQRQCDWARGRRVEMAIIKKSPPLKVCM